MQVSSTASWPGVQSRTRGSVPEIHELHRHGKLLRLDRANDRLQFVPALAGDADFVALNLGRNLEFAVADEAGDQFGDGGLDALLDLDDLARVAQRRDFRLGFLDALEADAAFGEPAPGM